MQTSTTGFSAAASHPQVIAERCVHTKLAQASCRCCIAACPLDAWVIDDDVMGIDADRCDGCGLCACACPQGAIVLDSLALALASQQSRAVNLACERTGIDGQQGIIPCLHAVGLRELLQLYRRGMRHLGVACGNCAECNRSGAQSLCDRIEALNDMLADRNLATLSLQVIPAEQWNPAVQAQRTDEVPVLSRRSFFRRVASSSATLAKDITGGLQQPGFLPPGKLLPRTDPDAIVSFVPGIDAARCNGCDACARLCPHGAIALHASEDQQHYRFDAECCSGCVICQDVCTQQAVSVDSWRPQIQFRLDLVARHCRACGAPYHLPAGQANHSGLCVVCTEINHVRNLYQVIEEPG